MGPNKTVTKSRGAIRQGPLRSSAFKVLREGNEPLIPKPRSKKLIKPPSKLLENCAVNFNQDRPLLFKVPHA